MRKKSINQLIKANFSKESFSYIEKAILSSKEYVKIKRKEHKKEEFIKCLKNNSDVNRLINYSAEYGINKEYLLNNYARRIVLNNLYLIGL